MTARNAAETTQFMTKTAFLAELHRRLSVMPLAEAEAAIAYYDEYLSEAGPENEAAAIADLGSPAQVATGILGDQVYADTTGEDKSVRKGLSALWMVVVGLFAAPVALPLAFVLIIVIFSVLIAILSAVFSAATAAITLLVAGLIYIAMGFVVLFSHFATGITTIGIGFIASALGAALTILMVWLAKHAINGTARGGSYLLRRFKTRGEAHNAY